MKKTMALLSVLILLFLGGCQAKDAPQGEYATGLHHAEIEIQNYGVISLELDADAAPRTVANFCKLANDKFYDGCTFHRIIDDFMMQGGAPKEGQAQADCIVGEFSENGVDNPLEHTRGTISMARSSQMDSASSQFFIVHKDSPHLNGNYAAFGHVTAGLEIVDAICSGTPVLDNNGTVAAANQPVITTIRILD